MSDSHAGFIGINVQGIQKFADVMKGHELLPMLLGFIRLPREGRGGVHWVRLGLMVNADSTESSPSGTMVVLSVLIGG